MSGQQLFLQRKDTLKATNLHLVGDAKPADNPRLLQDEKFPVMPSVNDSDPIIILYKHLSKLLCSGVVQWCIKTFGMTKQDPTVCQAALRAQI